MQGTNLTTSQPSSFTNTSISSTFSAANFTFQPIQSLPPFNSSSNLSKRALEEYLEETLGKRHKDLSEAVSLSIIYCVIFVTGVVGNTCTAAIVMRRPSMRTPTNFYLCSLALSDVITLIIGMPPELYQIWEAYPWIFGECYCLLRTYLLDLTSSASVFTITTFTVERYFAIRYPLISRTSSDTLRRVPVIIVIVWFLAGVVAIPYPIHMTLDFQRNYPNTEIGIPSSLLCSPDENWKEFYNHLLLFSFVCLFIIPICIISVLYTLIAITISKPPSSRVFSRRGPVTSLSSSSSATVHQSHKAVVKMLVAVVVAFFACWAPFHAQRLMATYIHTWSPLTLTIHNGLFHISGMLYYFACTVNPILYNLMSRKYRSAFKETLCPKCWNKSSYDAGQRSSVYYKQTRVGQVVSFKKSTPNGNPPAHVSAYV